MWKFYVYEIERDDRVVYVGKGCGRRAEVSAKERGGQARIIANFSHEEWALEFEKQRIAARIAEGCRLLNVAPGATVSWSRRTDTVAMAREVLEEMARRVGNWLRAGRLPELARICDVPCEELRALHQRFGA